MRVGDFGYKLDPHETAVNAKDMPQGGGKGRAKGWTIDS